MRSPSPSLSGLAFLRGGGCGLGRVRFLGFNFPSCSMKEGTAAVLWLGHEMLLVFSCIIEDTWREWFSAGRRRA